jgi:cytosine/adenosine deaminase-related metal-dependent hydrolase
MSARNALSIPAAASPRIRSDAPILLVGTALTPNGPVENCFVLIESGFIRSVSTVEPSHRGARVLHTQAVIAPGFVDLHNHVSFNVLPRWNPGVLFTNKYQWRESAEYLQQVDAPYSHLVSLSFCDMNTWGELRALVGGTTSIAATAASPCIHGLVRNLDYSSGFYGTTELDLEHVFNTLELPAATSPAARQQFVQLAHLLIADPFYEALMLHLAEGTDAVAHEEFTFMKSQSLLPAKGIFIHGTALAAADFADLAAAGTALVWSPRSNVELYGQTADIAAAVAAGVEIALAPDWAVTGSSNMLDELAFAAAWNDRHLGGLLTDRQLVEMATTVPARIAGVDDHVGAIRAGLRADIVLLKKGSQSDPYRAVVDARPESLELVLIDGVPLYGDRRVMRRFWRQSELERIDLQDGSKLLATPAAGGVVVADVAERLELALQAEGTSLAPLAE